MELTRTRPAGRRALVVLGALWLTAGGAGALGPHEILLLANSASPDSVAIAEHYARLRGVPPVNLVMLKVPLKSARGDGLTPAQFTRWIWEPARRAARERGIEGHILAWVYSSDFPTRVDTAPAMSLTGLTFVRNRPPPPPEVANGTYASALFNAPSMPGGRVPPARSLDTFAEWLGADMPLPAMMLGVTRAPHGNPRDVVLAGLARGAASDGSTPTGTVWLITSDDIRSRCRAWQYPGAAAELRRYGIAVQVTNAPPPQAAAVIGVQLGASNVDPSRYTFLPGALGEHLTSLGAVFEPHTQTRLTTWIAAGATASAGTVTEPYALWTKFPSAYVYVFQAAGATLLESLYQSVRCPLQLLPVGDPLAAPWKPWARLEVPELEDGVPTSLMRLRPRVASASGVDYRRFKYYVDGREVSAGPEFDYDPAALAATGARTLRIVAYRTGLLRHQVFGEWPIDTPR